MARAKVDQKVGMHKLLEKAIPTSAEKDVDYEALKSLLTQTINKPRCSKCKPCRFCQGARSSEQSETSSTASLRKQREMKPKPWNRGVIDSQSSSPKKKSVPSKKPSSVDADGRKSVRESRPSVNPRYSFVKSRYSIIKPR